MRFLGPDAASFLNALVTNDVTSLSPGLVGEAGSAGQTGEGCYAAWLSPQGRMITDLRLLRDTDAVCAEVPEGMAADLAARFDQLIFAENVQVIDDTPDTRAVVVFGARAADAVSAAAGVSAEDVRSLPTLGHLGDSSIRVIRTDDIALPNFLVWTPASRWEALQHALVAAGSINAPVDFLEALRIESGHPRFGVDLTPDTIPLEAGLLDRAISTTKGCYVGQEVIIRILHRGGGRVVKQLVRCAAAPGVTAVPVVGTQVFDAGRDVGVVTSAAIGPSSEQVVALAYVHRDSAEVGRTVSLGDLPTTISAVTA